MLNIIVKIAVATYITSTLFMLGFWLNAFVATHRREKKVFLMPLPVFLYYHFCPIVHTRKCFQIMKRYYKIKEERGL